MRLDTNYYHYPAAWIGGTPGFMTGSGLPMRFADLDGTLLDVYQAHTFMTDESGQAYPSTVNALLDKARSARGLLRRSSPRTCTPTSSPRPASDAIIASALARGVPVISAKQALDWTEGRNASSFRSSPGAATR